LGIAVTIEPKDVKDFRDLIIEKTWGYSAEDIKKMQAAKGKGKK